jgi:hypothetical protein
MPVSINVKCDPDQTAASELRNLICRESAYVPTEKPRNPLMETNFNELLERVVQYAFDEGRRFEKKHPNLSA